MNAERWLKHLENETPLVEFVGNIGCSFDNITINAPIIIPSESGYLDCNYDTSFDSIRVDWLECSSSQERQQKLNETLEQFHSIVLKTYANPIIRYTGTYSGFSSFWQSNNTADIAMLELEEQKQLISLVMAGCIIYVLITLDVKAALLYGFTKAETQYRIANLCEVCDQLSKYKNFKVAVDCYGCQHDPIMIFSDVLINQDYRFLQRKDQYQGNYSHSIWCSDQDRIRFAIERYDREFYHALLQTRQLYNGLIN